MHKKIFIGIFAFQLLTGFYFGEIMVQSGNFLHHYQEHQYRNYATDFISFVKLHYFNTKHQKSEPTKHQKLPFYPTVQFATVFFLPAFSTLSLAIPEDHVSFVPMPQFLSPSTQVDSIFQPPQ